MQRSLCLALCTAVMLALALSGAAFAEKIVMTAETDRGSIGTFTVDTETHSVAYELNPDMVGGKRNVVRIHGWAPAGWDSKPLLEINPNRSLSGVWHYRPEDEANVLDGLAYITLSGQGRQRGETVRAQIEPGDRAVMRFPEETGLMTMAGTCNVATSLSGVVENAVAQMDPAQVRMERSAPGDRDKDGLRDITLAVQVRVGGGYVPGLGRMEVELINDKNPGFVEALSPDADFPARMTMTIAKRYITPVGTFVGEAETYTAIVHSLPPFGVELTPTSDSLRLFDEKTGEVVGTFRPGNVIPLFHVAESKFPGPLAGTAPTPAPVTKASVDKGRARRSSAPKPK